MFQDYYLLESRGLVHAAPRSGYFVTARADGVLLAEPHTSEPQSGSQPDEVNDLIYACLGAARARDIVHFGSAFPSPVLFPLDRLRRALVSSTRRLEPWSMLEDLPPGNLRLKREIAKRYLRQGMTVATEEIVLTHGAMEALNLCLNAGTRPGDAVVVESPTFYMALQALQRLGLRAIEVPTHVGAKEPLAPKAIRRSRHQHKSSILISPLQRRWPDRHTCRVPGKRSERDRVQRGVAPCSFSPSSSSLPSRSWREPTVARAGASRLTSSSQASASGTSPFSSSK